MMYNLPFERFFHKKKDSLPAFNIYISKKDKSTVIRHLYEKYGKDFFIRCSDDESEYFVSSKPINETFIKECLTVTTADGETYEENISRLKGDELKKLNLYGFRIVEVETLQYSAEDEFDEERILEEKKMLFNDEYRNFVSPFTEIEEIKNYLKDTEYIVVIAPFVYDVVAYALL